MKIYKSRLRFQWKFVPKGPVNNIPAFVQTMAWRRPTDKPLPEPMKISLLTYICVTLPQCVKVKSQSYLLSTSLVAIINMTTNHHGKQPQAQCHYSDVIMGGIAVYSTVYSDADQRKHQSSASLAFVRRIHRSPVNSPRKWPVTRIIFPFDDVIMAMDDPSEWVTQWDGELMM